MRLARLRNGRVGGGGDPECDHLQSGGQRGDVGRANVSGFHGSARISELKDKPYIGTCGKCGARRVDLQIGLEQSLPEYIDNILAVAAGVWRVLRDDGVFWLNLGDSRKDSQLLMVPARVALALQAAGWYLRSEVIWDRMNPMPESVTNRPTKAHEMIYMLAKRPDYYYDYVAVQQPAVTAPHRRGGVPNSKQTAGPMDRNGASQYDPNEQDRVYGSDGTRNLRTVWSIPSTPFRGAHFACFPPKLIVPMVLAGTSQVGQCPRCGAPYRRVVERERVATRPGTDTKVTGNVLTDGNRDPEWYVTTTRTVGWQPGCACNAGPPVPQIILDTFMGSGTTAMVAVKYGRRAIGCELNPAYLKFIEDRVKQATAQRGFGLLTS